MTRLGRGELYAALAAIGYGSAYVATAFALRSFGPLPIAVFRTFLGGLGLVAILVVSRRPGDPSAVRPRAAVRAVHLAIIATCGGPIFLTAMNLAIAGVGATVASFVAGLYAIFAAVLAPFVLREHLRPRALAGFLVALVGTGFLAELDLGGTGLGGIAWGLVAAVAFALFIDLSRKWSRADGFDGIVVALATMTATTVAVGAYLLLTNPGSLSLASLVPEAGVAILWLAVVAAGGQALAVASTHHVPASRTAAFLLLNPVTATILSFVLLGERVASVQVLGGALVLLGMAAATIDRAGRAVDRGRPAGQGR